MSKTLYVVLDRVFETCAFVTYHKETIESFKSDRPNYDKSFIIIEVTDKEKRNKFIKEFGDNEYEILGDEVLLLDYEYEMYANGIPTLLHDLDKEIKRVIDVVKYIKLSDAEFETLMSGLCILHNKFKSYYDENDVDDDVQIPDIFNEAELARRFIQDSGRGGMI